MPHPLLTLQDRLDADIYVEPAVSGRSVAFWRERTAAALRVTADVSSGVTEDGDVAWTPAFAHELERVKKSFWQKLRGAELEGVVLGPGQADYRPTGPRAQATLAWTEDPGGTLLDALGERIVPGKSEVVSLGKSVGVIRGAPPVIKANLQQCYGPAESPLIDASETRRAIQQGMDFLLGQVLDYPQQGEHPEAALLRNLKEFRRHRARWAELRGKDIVAMESTGVQGPASNTGWMAVVPRDNEIVRTQAHTVLVRREPGGVLLMRILPHALTREWAGLVGVHELEHLENIVTGKEPANATREEFIEGEIRAYGAETAAADVLSKGGFRRGLDAVIDGYDIRSFDKLRDAYGSPVMHLLAQNLDRYITPEAPKSRAETGFRLGFYFIAAAFRLAERLGGAEALEAKKEVIRFCYGKDGAGILEPRDGQDA